MASGGLILLLGFALFFNVAVIMWKFQQGMETNAFIDGAVLGAIFWLFSGTMSALAIGTIASAMSFLLKKERSLKMRVLKKT